MKFKTLFLLIWVIAIALLVYSFIPSNSQEANQNLYEYSDVKNAPQTWSLDQNQMIAREIVQDYREKTGDFHSPGGLCFIWAVGEYCQDDDVLFARLLRHPNPDVITGQRVVEEPSIDSETKDEQ